MLHVNTTEQQQQQQQQQQEQFPQPSLVASTTEDDDEDDAHAALVQDVQASHGANREALAYLLRYETMIRQQEAEDMATLAHVRPCIERLEELAGIPQPQRTASSARRTIMESDSALLTREISFRHLKRALEALERQEASSQQDTTVVTGDNSSFSAEFMTTDRQLMMVLRLLTQKIDSFTNEDDDDDMSIAWADDDDVSIAWAEFFQAYKV